MTEVENSPLRVGAPAGSPNSYGSKEQITTLLRGTDPGTVTASGQGYLDLAAAYEKAMAQLRTFAHDLANAWKGPASSAAQAQLRELFKAASEISARSTQVGNAVKTHGTNYLSWYRQNMPTPRTVEEARQWMQGANARAVETWSAIPPDIATGLPSFGSSDPRYEHGSPPGGGPGSGAPSAAKGGGGPGGGSPPGTRPGSGDGSLRPGPGTANMNGGHGHGPGHEPGSMVRHTEPGGHQQVAGSPPGGQGGGTRLAGFGPPGGTSGGLGQGGLGPSTGGAGGPGPGVPPGTGLPPGSAGPGLPGGGAGGPLPGGGSAIGPGLMPGPGSPEGPLGRGLTGGGGAGQAAGRPGAPGAGFPGTPGHPGHDGGRERGRGSWIPDEPDIWDDGVEAVPGIIGEAPPKPVQAGGQAPEDEATLLRRVLARLEELESREEAGPPAAAPPRLKWTD